MMSVVNYTAALTGNNIQGVQVGTNSGTMNVTYAGKESSFLQPSYPLHAHGLTGCLDSAAAATTTCVTYDPIPTRS